jgi:hypothetical protein
LQRDVVALKSQVAVQTTVIKAKNEVIQQVLSDAKKVVEQNKQLTATATPQEAPVMASKFVSALEHIGKDVEHGLIKAAPIAAQLAGLFPGGSEIKTAIQFTTNAIALAQQSGQTNEQKLASVVNLANPYIQDGLAKLGKSNTDADVKNFVNMLVELMNFIPESTVANLKTVTIGAAASPLAVTE